MSVRDRLSLVSSEISCHWSVQTVIYGLPSSLYYHYRRDIKRNILSYSRDQSSCVPSQWEMLLQCNDISHWLGAHLHCSLLLDHVVRRPNCITVNFIQTAPLWTHYSSPLQIICGMYFQSTKSGIFPVLVIAVFNVISSHIGLCSGYTWLYNDGEKANYKGNKIQFTP